ncbi:MAG: bifunctional precorrin-2 dehydrogenase/sirohydrochlorin ferrochelatase [Thermodesulfobacteriota bacterium]
MKYFPINVEINNRPCTVIGGGRVAQRKVMGLLACQGQVTVISPELTPALAEKAGAGAITWLKRGYEPGDLARSFLVIAATDDEQVQEAVYAEAQGLNILINVADVPKWCNFILPATVRRGDLAISISTSGQSPALARLTRERLEEEFGPEYDLALRLMGGLRPLVLARDEGHEQNKKTFAKILHPELLEWLAQGQWPAISAHIQALLGHSPEIDTLLTRLREEEI